MPQTCLGASLTYTQGQELYEAAVKTNYHLTCHGYPTSSWPTDHNKIPNLSNRYFIQNLV